MLNGTAASNRAAASSSTHARFKRSIGIRHADRLQRCVVTLKIRESQMNRWGMYRQAPAQLFRSPDGPLTQVARAHLRAGNAWSVASAFGLDPVQRWSDYRGVGWTQRSVFA